MEWILLLLMVAVLYLLMIRPQQKRVREQQEMVNALQAGDRVVLSSGIFATVSHSGESQAIVELAPGTEVTMLKTSIIRKAREDEEEFEFDDSEATAAETEIVEETIEPETVEAAEVEGDLEDSQTESETAAEQTDPETDPQKSN